MPKLSREGHRERLRSRYLQNPDAEMDDSAILELLLTYAIPRKDVKPIAYELLNEFRTIENITNASISELKEIEGIGESSAILISLIGKINGVIKAQREREPKRLNSTEKVVDYVMKKIGDDNIERFIVITLDSENDIINCHNISDGSTNNAYVDKARLIRRILNDHASSVIIAHNHPNGNVEPSASDVNTTVDILGILRSFGIKLIDHIIVNKSKAFCMSSSLKYAEYFD